MQSLTSEEIDEYYKLANGCKELLRSNHHEKMIIALGVMQHFNSFQVQIFLNQYINEYLDRISKFEDGLCVSIKDTEISFAEVLIWEGMLSASELQFVIYVKQPGVQISKVRVYLATMTNRKKKLLSEASITRWKKDFKISETYNQTPSKLIKRIKQILEND